MKKPELQIKTYGGWKLHFKYGWSAGELYGEGKIGVGFSSDNDGPCVIGQEEVDTLIEFLIVCRGLLVKDNSISMRNLRKRNKQWYADIDMELEK